MNVAQDSVSIPLLFVKETVISVICMFCSERFVIACCTKSTLLICVNMSSATLDQPDAAAE
ncbi:MAG: hypothetical protein ACC608_05740 [Anaerofustis sp.]